MNETTENVEEVKIEEANQIDDLTQVAQLTKEIEEHKAKYLYLAAEMDNVKKRNQREQEQIHKYGQEKILKDLVEVVDNFDRTVEALRLDNDDKVKNIVVGIDMVRKQFLDTLSKHGLTTIACVGEFDPNFHEALGQEKVEGAKKNEISKVFQNGYVLSGRVLRAATVMIAQ